MSRWGRGRDPDLANLRKALRVAVVLPALLAFGLWAVEDRSFALFAAFGSFAMLGFADFGGPLGRRALAYLTFTVVGGALVVLGTVVSSQDLLAVIVTVVVVLAVQTVAAFGGSWAAASSSAVLAYVLAVMIPAADLSQAVPQAGGWLLAGAVCTVAAVVLWPSRQVSVLQRELADLVARLAAVLRTWEVDPRADGEVGDAHRGPTPVDRATAAADLLSSSRALTTTWATMRMRPAGPAVRHQALGYLIQEVRQLVLLVHTLDVRTAAVPLSGADRALVDEAVATVTAVGRRLAGGPDTIDLEALDRARVASLAALEEEVRRSPAHPSGGGAAGGAEDGAATGAVIAAVERSWTVRMLAHGALSIGAGTRVLTGGVVDPSRYQPPPTVPAEGSAKAWARGARIVRSHLSWRSAWARNAVRAAVALAVAVGLARAIQAEHGFWVALGTLSVLRSSVSATTSTALQALAGTVVGFAITVALLAVMGDQGAALWLGLAITAFLSAWTPTVVHFVVGQASFTLFVVVLFDLVDPAGWRTGLVRLQDIALGVAVAVGVGLVLWPRGVASQLGAALGGALRAAGDYAAGAFGAALDDRGGDEPIARGRAASAARDAEDTVMLAVSDRHDHRLPLDAVARLLVGIARLRHVGDSLGRYPAGPLHRHGAPEAVAAIERAALDLGDAVSGVASTLARPAPAPPPAGQPVLDGQGASGRPDALAPSAALGPAVRDRLAAEIAAGADTDTVVTLVFVSCWLRFGEDVVELIEPAAEVVARRGANRWWG